MFCPQKWRYCIILAGSQLKNISRIGWIQFLRSSFKTTIWVFSIWMWRISTDSNVNCKIKLSEVPSLFYSEYLKKLKYEIKILYPQYDQHNIHRQQFNPTGKYIVNSFLVEMTNSFQHTASWRLHSLYAQRVTRKLA